MASRNIARQFATRQPSLALAVQKLKVSNKMNTLTDYFRSQQIPLQWSPFLRALAQELIANADKHALHQLFTNVGSRFATTVLPQFSGISTLKELNDALNGLWAPMSWGYVKLTEASTAIEIEHRYAPLAEAFGDEMLEWSVGVMEGFYQSVFRSFGASEKMTASYVPEKSDAMQIHLRLAP
jgi:Cellulose synthase subunit D